MTKTLNDFLEVYKPKSPDEQKFVDKHVTIKFKDRNGNGDDVFKGNTKIVKRKEGRHGYDVGEDEKVYEELKGDQHKIDANKNGKIDAHDFHLLRKRKKVAEDTQIDELSGATLGSYAAKSRKDEMARKERGIKVRDEIRKQTGMNVGTPIDRKLYSRTTSRGAGQKMALKKLTGQARVNANEEVELGEDTAGDVVRANHRIMQHQQHMKNIMNADMGNPFQKIIQIRDAKKHLASLHADRQNAIAKHEEEMKKSKVKPRKKKVSESTSNRPSHKDIAYNDPEMIKHREIQRYLHNQDIDRDAARKEKARKEKANEEVILDDLLDEALDILNSIDEKTLTSAEMKKREEVVKAIKRGNPKMDRSTAYAIATKTAKRVAEGTMPTADEPTDANKRTAQKVRDLLAREKKPVKKDSKEMNEEEDDGWYTHNEMHGKVSKEKWKKGWRYNHLKDKPFYHQPTKTWHASIKEESNQIDELSKKTLVSYANKAAFKIGDQGITAGLKIQNNEPADKNFKTMGKRQKGIAAAVGKLAKEEVEAIDELSKGKLNAYYNKAKWAGKHGSALKWTTDDLEDVHPDEREGLKKYIDRKQKSFDLAGDKLMGRAKVNAKGVRPAVPKDPNFDPWKGRNAPPDSSVKFDSIGNPKRYGPHRYGAYNVKEDTQIDELSKNTLGSYISRATNQAFGKGYTGGSMKARGIITRDSEEENAGEKNVRKGVKRIDGVVKAVRKLTREDIINRTIEKYVPEDIKFTPEERLLKRIDGLSEGHIDTLLGLFEALNIDNQNKMIKTVESHEGINQLLNFALENKGE